MDKEQILQEIRRTAKENGGIPLGRQRFFNETGIKVHEWLGKYWARWSEAVVEAGFSPNKLQGSHDETMLLNKYIGFARELGRLPVPADLLLKSRNDPDFPSGKIYQTRFSSKSALVARLLEYCDGHPEFEDVVRLLKEYSPRRRSTEDNSELAEARLGFVYLIKHGSRHEYKIGKTFNPVRREGEIILQLPEKVQPVHYIKTDDPSGVEAYWHSRFSNKRKEGEWFELTPSDVRVFKRWKRIF